MDTVYKKYVIYRKSDGKIKRTLKSTVIDIGENYDPSTEAYIEGEAHVLNCYVDGGKVKKRPEMEVELSGTDGGCMLSNLPVPCVIKVNCTAYPNEYATEEEILFDQYGTYNISISAWPYFDKEFTYEHTAP
jgi:hypothetical protein